MTWDLIIAGGLVFDGHGTKPRREDIAVSDGCVVARGVDLPVDQAAQVIDASASWVIPGLLDIHTHVDLEVELDPTLQEVLRHGTTTTVMSNCSLGLAFGNQRVDGEDPIVDCFARVENIPKHVLEAVAEKAVWRDPVGYLDHLAALPLGVNVVPMLPHSMLRAEVMGLQASVDRRPTDAEIAEMERLTEEAMQAGYVGFSTDALPFHYLANDPNRQKKIPTQWTTHRELGRLVDVLRRHDRVWQATPAKDSPVDALRTFLHARGRGKRGRPVKLTAVAALDLASNRSVITLARALTGLMNSVLVGGDFRLQALGAPFRVWGDGPITPQFEEIATLRRLNEPDLEDVESRRAIIEDPEWQTAFRAMWTDGKDGRGIAGLKRRLRIEDYTITRDLDDMTVDGVDPVAAWDGHTLGEIHRRATAFQSGDLVVDDDQERAAYEAMPPLADEAAFLIHLLHRYDTGLRWWMVSANNDLERMKKALFDPAFLPGFNDSGAHLTNMAFYDVGLRGLRHAMTDGLDRVSTHISRLTKVPAEFFGLDVGTLDLGARADIAVISPDALEGWDTESTHELIWRDAFQNHQLVNRPPGVVTDVIVGGHHLWHEGRPTHLLGTVRAGAVLTTWQHPIR